MKGKGGRQIFSFIPQFGPFYRTTLLISVCFFQIATTQNSVASVVNAVNFSLKTPDDQWIYCETRGCSFWTRKPERMIRHRQCHRPDTKYYKCPDCSLRFYSLAKMLKHDRKVHTGVKDYECRVCEAEVTDIQIHMRVRKFSYTVKPHNSGR